MKRFAALALGPVLLIAGCAGKPQGQPAVAQIPVSVPPIPAATPVAFTKLATLPLGGTRLEAEKATLTGNTIQTKTAGFSGSGYVGGFEKDGAKIVWTLPHSKPGLYDVRIRYSAPFGPKAYDLVINGAKLSGQFAATGDRFATQDAGKVELTAGMNTVEIDRGWGYFEIDVLDLVPAAAVAAALPKPPLSLSDPHATPQARALMARLVRGYGRKTLSGQYQAPDTAAVLAETGKTPAIFGTDLMDYSPSRVARGGMPRGVTEAAIVRARAGQIVTVSWHWNAPSGLLDRMTTDAQGKPLDARWYKGFNTNATTFDVQKALADPNSADYKLLLQDMDAIAVQLQKFQAAGVPILWRPLHEAEGGWFWWGARGPEAYKQLWRLLYDRLVNIHGLHTLIWVYSATQSLQPEWYPGDAYVDIVGTDAYPPDTSDPLDNTWETMQNQYSGKKLISLTEFGGVPDVDKMRRYGVRWAYFVTWNGYLNKTPKDVVTRVYRSPAVVAVTPH